MTTRFTGRHMAALLTGFFALVIAVNFTMASFASSTFGGMLARNGYVASQDYNRWVADARAQDRLGWTLAASVDGGRLVLDLAGVSDPAAEVRLAHPLGRVAETRLAMVPAGPHRLVSRQRLMPGRWQAHIVIRKGKESARFLMDVAA